MNKYSILLIFLSILISCKNSKEEAAKTLHVTSALWSVVEEQQAIKEEILPIFEEETGIKVVLETLKLSDMLQAIRFQKESAKVSTDIIIPHNGSMPIYINDELVIPLDDIQFENTSFIDAFSSSMTSQGSTYFFPIAADVYLLIANKKALAYLPANASIENLTWDQYADWAINIANGEGTGKLIAPSKPQNNFLYQFGAISLSYGAPYPSINSPQAIEAWKILEKMAAGNAYIAAMDTIDNPVPTMKSEEAWLSVFHMNPIGEIYQFNPTLFEIGPAPSGPAGNGSIAGSYGIGIVNGSSNVEAAKEFIKFITRSDILLEASLSTGGFIPPVEEVLDSLADSSGERVIKEGISTLLNGSVSGLPISDYQDWGAVKTTFDEAFLPIYRNGAIDTDVLNEQEENLQALKKN